MEAARQIISIVLVAGGVLFFMVGTVGLLRLPDALTRMHAATKADTLGVGMVLAGIAVAAGLAPATIKLLVIIAFIWLTNPTATHVMARVAFRDEEHPPAITAELDLDAEEDGGSR